MRHAVLASGLLLALSPLPLCADAVADVKAGLDRLSAEAPLRVRVETARTETEKDKPKGPERRGVAVVEHGPAGLSVHLDPAQLPKPGTKAERKKREETIVRLSLEDSMKLVDPVSELRQLLEGSTLVSDRVEPFEGKRLRTVVFRPVPDVDEDDRKALKKYEDVVTLRVDEEDVPLAMERSLDLKFAKLLISFTVTQRESRRFSRANGRLVTATATEESHGSGLGQSGGSKTRWTVTPL